MTNFQINQSKKNTICIVSQFFPPDFAATGQLLKELVYGLAKKGLFIEVITSMPAYAYLSKRAISKETNKNLTIKRSRILCFSQKKLFWKVLNGLIFCIKITVKLIMKSKKFSNIVYTTEPAFLPLFANFVHLINKKKFIVITYDLYPDIITNFKILDNKNLLIKIWKFLLNKTYKNASKIIVLSDPMKERLIKTFPSTKNKAEVISSWADHEKIKNIKRQNNWFIKKHNLLGKFVVLYSGNQGKCHDLLTIVRAAKELESNSAIIFLFIGDGAQNNNLKSMANKLDLKNCIFLPYQKYEDLSFSLSSADVAIVSFTKEASSLVAPSKLYGHLAVGTPIAGICPEFSYLKKLIDDNKFGEAFKNGDFKNLSKWIYELYENNNTKKSYSKRTRRFLIRYANKEDIFDKYYSILSM